jgi:Skp family chaperone for outer membrane proteins
MKHSMWKKLACAGLLAAAFVVSGCGGGEKVAVVNLSRIEMESPKVKGIIQEIDNKNREIADRLSQEQGTLSDEEMQKKVAEAQQERAIFINSKQKQVQSMVEAQCAVIAKDKGYTIIMRDGTVPAGADDITDEVLAKIDGQGAASSSSTK